MSFRNKTNWTIAALESVLSYKDFGLNQHCLRLQQASICCGKEMDLTSFEISRLRLFARFHDLGKVLIPDEVLFKPGRLTEAEWDQMKMHSRIGSSIAASIIQLQDIADLILKHHERWDGAGYPLGISGTEIPLFCRILAIADTFDAMTNERSYRVAVSHSDAIKEIEECAEKQFDPELVEFFLKHDCLTVKDYNYSLSLMVNGAR